MNKQRKNRITDRTEGARQCRWPGVLERSTDMAIREESARHSPSGGVKP